MNEFLKQCNKRLLHLDDNMTFLTFYCEVFYTAYVLGGSECRAKSTYFEQPCTGTLGTFPSKQLSESSTAAEELVRMVLTIAKRFFLREQ